ncbi:ABC transporter ATP-binding protein [Undibacterium terreum]|uniref:ABC transporter domain-containing protein n=1 Tax=Undibacterium terreum TaxID=1224302 RepID=A0A916UBL4_9BURK|nr:ABC transporter ATP-binding protein [Undibacterium terreum]GGC65846.1 hypothetical protein GCM10011396_11030 [Undibacterium terreum]
MPMNPYVIETENLSLYYGRKPALNSLSLQIPRGGIHALIGANGAGKSSLFRVLLGFETPIAGRARILGQDCSALTPELRARIGFVNEEHTLPDWMRVDELTRLQRSNVAWNQESFEEVVRNFNVQPQQKISQLSRGERAGVSLALALGQRPELLILDEPTLGLDMVAKRTLLESLMYSSAAQETTIIYCSHQMEEIERIADHLIIMELGRLRYMSEPDELCQRVRLWAADMAGNQADLHRLPGLLEIQQIDGVTQLMMMDAPADFETHLGSMGARHISNSAVGLNRAVDSLLASGHISRRAAGNFNQSGSHHA